MKQERKSLWDKLIGKKEEPSTSTPVVVTAYSQPHVLQQRMKEEKLTHGERVIADIGPVRLESYPAGFTEASGVKGKSIIYFCPVDVIDIKTRLNNGDGGSLPSEATVNGLSVGLDLKPGLYTLRNVELYSNGTLQVNATPKTEFVSI
jgi:hypothetical protein